MTVVASETSPLNCRWIEWRSNLPVCTRPPATPHLVSESECAICDHWDEASPRAVPGHTDRGAHLHRAHPDTPDPLNREACPRCGSHDVALTGRDALVQSFTCTICHQRWLATRPWPLLRESRSRR